MKTLARVAALAAFSVTAMGAASAAIITIDSNNTTVKYNGPVATDAGLTVAPAGSTTFNLPTNGIWTAPIGGSQWVAQNAQDFPGGSNTEPSGIYQFFSTFTDMTPGTSGGNITVMADDTTSIYLNGNLITNQAGAATAGKCTIDKPNCTTPATYNLTGFVSGTNVLTFNVHQIYGFAEGLDFEAVVNTAVPEPSSLMLLGTGLVGSAGMFFRRLRA